ncbi:4a-hydroxytetrahydrobiopterin dehydratase [Lentzea alba]|uniref:4a-hydroxytetrahydrobiopterin dehydratase n=1 Tax=Lentzea alba TaxID=2714351 RepID=UPI0039BF4176
MGQVFISYRRSDTAPVSGRLHAVLRETFGHESVFLDTSSIQPGTVWPDELEVAVTAADVVLVVIGPNWLRAANEWGERLIDQPADWVRRELELALALEKPVIPVLVGGARMAPRDKLPGAVAALGDRQAVELREAYFDHDVELVVSQMRSLMAAAPGAIGPFPSGPYPVPPLETPDPISSEKLDIALRGALSEWTVMESPLPEDPSDIRVELFREYRFRRFRDAIAFMQEVAPGCDIANHHPRWENIWRTVRVYLTTWDIGHRVSDRDIQLAKYFDAAYLKFAGADR